MISVVFDAAKDSSAETEKQRADKQRDRQTDNCMMERMKTIGENDKAKRAMPSSERTGQIHIRPQEPPIALSHCPAHRRHNKQDQLQHSWLPVIMSRRAHAHTETDRERESERDSGHSKYPLTSPITSIMYHQCPTEPQRQNAS